MSDAERNSRRGFITGAASLFSAGAIASNIAFACPDNSAIMTDWSLRAAAPAGVADFLSGGVWQSTNGFHRRECSFDPITQMMHVLCGETVLLGEVHDNPVHHKLRSEIVASMIYWNGRTSLMFPTIGSQESMLPKRLASYHPALIFEQIRADQQLALDQFAELRKDPKLLGGKPIFKRPRSPPRTKDSHGRACRLDGKNWIG